MIQNATWPADPDTYVCARQVAAKLGYRSLKTFYNARNGELAARSFPAPSIGRRWKAAVIERWEALNDHAALTGQLAGQRTAPANDDAPAPIPAPPAGKLLAHPSPARARLDEIRRAAGLNRT